MNARAEIIPSLVERIKQHLEPLLARMGASASDYLHGCATALALRRSAPSLDPIKAALGAYTSEITALRNEGRFPVSDE